MATKLLVSAGFGGVGVAILTMAFVGYPRVSRSLGEGAAADSIKTSDTARKQAELHYQKQIQRLEQEYGEGKMSTVERALAKDRRYYVSGGVQTTVDKIQSSAIAALDKSLHPERA